MTFLSCFYYCFIYAIFILNKCCSIMVNKECQTRPTLGMRFAMASCCLTGHDCLFSCCSNWRISFRIAAMLVTCTHQLLSVTHNNVHRALSWTIVVYTDHRALSWIMVVNTDHRALSCTMVVYTD